MNIKYYNPGSTSGPDGFINFNMSGGNSGNGCGCSSSLVGWIIIFIIYIIYKMFQLE